MNGQSWRARLEGLAVSIPQMNKESSLTKGSLCCLFALPALPALGAPWTRRRTTAQTLSRTLADQRTSQARRGRPRTTSTDDGTEMDDDDGDDGGAGGGGGFGRASFVSVLDIGAARAERTAARAAVLAAEEERYKQRVEKQKRRELAGQVTARVPSALRPVPRAASSSRRGRTCGTGDVDGAGAGAAAGGTRRGRCRRIAGRATGGGPGGPGGTETDRWAGDGENGAGGGDGGEAQEAQEGEEQQEAQEGEEGQGDAPPTTRAFFPLRAFSPLRAFFPLRAFS